MSGSKICPLSGVGYTRPKNLQPIQRYPDPADERIGFHALYSTGQTPPPDSDPPQDGQLAGQLTIDDAVNDDATEHRAQAQA